MTVMGHESIGLLQARFLKFVTLLFKDISGPCKIIQLVKECFTPIGIIPNHYFSVVYFLTKA